MAPPKVKTLNVDDPSRDNLGTSAASAPGTQSVVDDDDQMLDPAGQSTRPPDNASKKMIGAPATVRIVLEENENTAPNGQPFGINGKAYMLMPGVAADVPVGIIDVLNNAKQVKARVDPLTKRIVGHVKQPRFSWRKLEAGAEA